MASAQHCQRRDRGTKHGNAILETRSRIHSPRRLAPPAVARSSYDSARADLPKSEAKVEPKPEQQVTLELRRSQD